MGLVCSYIHWIRTATVDSDPLQRALVAWWRNFWLEASCPNGSQEVNGES
jgi:hypothetical protein